LIPSLTGGQALVALVRRLAAEDAVGVIVADNGLAPTTVSEIREAGGDVAAMGRNLGFGAAVNRAAKAARGDVLVVLNDDVEPGQGFVRELVSASEGAGMVAGVLLRAEAPRVIETAGIVLDAALGPYDYLAGEPISRLEGPLAPPLGPCGGAAAYRADLFRSVGGFDEGFFAYFEDADLALRLRAAGASCALAPRARAVHAGSATLGYGSLAKASVVGYSRGYLLRKYGVLRRPRSAAQGVAAELAASLLLARRHRSLEPFRARVRGFRACSVRAPWPGPGVATVSLRDGMSRRSRRASRPV